MKLYKHQEEALKQTEGFNRCAYYLDMGLGKTYTGSEKMTQLGARVNLVVCQKSKVQDWVNHFVENYADNQMQDAYDLTNKKDFIDFVEYSKTEYDGNPIVAVINYELAWRRPELLKLKDFTLMLDESSLIQNRKAKMTKFILKLKPANVILLSGTPCSGKYENLWTQAHLLGWDITEDLYNRHYINRTLVDYGGIKFWQVDKKNPYKNVERLKEKFRSYGSVFMKTEDVFDLPEQTFIDVKVAKSKMYSKFMKDSIITIEHPVTEEQIELVGDTSLTKMLYARQLCGQYSEAKLEAFKDILNSTQDRLIVFYNFTEELNLLKTEAMMQGRPTSMVNGSVKDLTSYEQEDDSVTFIQYQAGAMGLNLQKANKIIYYSLPLRSELFEQSKKRIHRIGQNKPCFYYSLICQGTVEEQIQKTLKERKDFTDELFRQNM